MPQLQDIAISRGQKLIQSKKQSCSTESTESFPYMTTQSVDVLPGLSASSASMQRQVSVPVDNFAPNMNTTVDSLPNILEHCKCEEIGMPSMVHMPNMTLDSLPEVASGTLDSLPNFNDGFVFEAATMTSDSLPIIYDRSFLDERTKSMTVESLPTVFESDDPVKGSHTILESVPEVSEKINTGLPYLATLE